MKKKIFIIISTILLLVIGIYQSQNKQTTFIIPISDRTALFSMGSVKQIRKYLENPNHVIHLMDYYYLIDRDRCDIIEIILKEYNHNPNYSGYKEGSPLTYAAQELKINCVRTLIKYGADVNYADENGDTPLTITVDEAFARPKVKYKSREISKLLIDGGADVNAVGKWFTPLGGAIASKDMVNAKYMVEHGADISFTDVDGANYLFSCFSIECIVYFLDKGLNINAVNKKGQSFIQNAVTGRIEKVDEIKKLMELGANICHKDNKGFNILNYIEEAGMNPHWKTNKPEVYNKHLIENKNKKSYKYLEKEYKKQCLNENSTIRVKDGGE